MAAGVVIDPGARDGELVGAHPPRAQLIHVPRRRPGGNEPRERRASSRRPRGSESPTMWETSRSR